MKRGKHANRMKAHRLTHRGHRKATPPKHKSQTFFTRGKVRF